MKHKFRQILYCSFNFYERALPKTAILVWGVRGKGCPGAAPQPNDPKTRKFVRTHVMHNHQQQKRRIQDMEIESQDDDAETILELKRPLIASPERWSRDPFDSFPIKMQPYMHELLHLCKSTAPRLLNHQIINYKYHMTSWHGDL
jgi:hypothetical protein